MVENALSTLAACIVIRHLVGILVYTFRMEGVQRSGLEPIATEKDEMLPSSHGGLLLSTHTHTYTHIIRFIPRRSLSMQRKVVMSSQNWREVTKT